MDLAKVTSVTGFGNGRMDQGLGRLETCGVS